MKYAILPQALTPAELIGGNGLVEMGTFVAILAGTLVAGVLVALDGGTVWVSALILIVGGLGFLASLAIPKAPPAAASLAFDWNPLRETWSNLKFAKQNRTVFLSLLGISWFWFYGLLFLSQFPVYSRQVLGGNEHVVTLLLASVLDRRCNRIAAVRAPVRAQGGNRIGAVRIDRPERLRGGLVLRHARQHFAQRYRSMAISDATGCLADRA